MNQAGHIFVKDARHLRWEIAISLVLMVAYVVVAPVLWKPRGGGGADAMVIQELQGVASILGMLVGVSWWILVTRVVQSESLVGDRQWWITKPYEWNQLLGGKLLFVGAFLFLPIVIAKGVVLAEGGFTPFAWLPGLGYSLVLFAAYLILPLMAIAMVTSTFARATLTILGVLVAFVAIEAIVAISRVGGFTVWWTGWPTLAILLCAACGGIGLQYARRATWITRLILAGGLVLVSVAFALPGDSALIALTYPQAAAPLQLSYDAGSKVTNYSQSSGSRRIGIGVPVQVSGIAAGRAVNLDAMQVTAEAADGRRWKSDWESLWGVRYRSDTDPSLTPPLPLQIDRAFFQAEQRKPVTLHLRFAVTELRASTPIRIAMPTHDFAVPGFGICMPLDADGLGDYTDLHCRNALRQPSATFVEVQWSDAKCGGDGASPGTLIPGHAWVGVLTSEPATLGLNAVEEVGFDSGLTNRERQIPGSSGTEPRYLCPGSPITFTSYAVDRRTEYDVTFSNYQMPEMPPGYRFDN
jgi:hypothetical protein